MGEAPNTRKRGDTVVSPLPYITYVQSSLLYLYTYPNLIKIVSPTNITPLEFIRRDVVLATYV